jgi:hypothetical protein
MKVEFVEESCLNFGPKVPSLFFWAARLLSFGVVISHRKRLKFHVLVGSFKNSV